LFTSCLTAARSLVILLRRPFSLTTTRSLSSSLKTVVAFLAQLSNESGARTFLLREIGDGELLRQDCEAISNELREQYTVGFVAPDPSGSGYRSLRVEVPSKPEFSVRVRKGVTVAGGTEYAGTGAPTP
jgi:hypothetical protein